MAEIKKKQHYVWKQYLKSWSNDESVWTYFKELKKIEKPNLTNVAQERYFYKLYDFNQEEEFYLRLFIENLAPDLKEHNIEFLNMFLSPSRLKSNINSFKNEFLNDSILKESIRAFENNLMEDAHCQLEAHGFKLINYKSLEELMTIWEGDYIYSAMMFICAQFYRTRKMKNAVLNAIKGKENEDLIKKAWHIISHCMGTVLAKRICFNSNLKFLFLENPSNNYFITSDQPVFNLLKDLKNEKGNVIYLELYYPLSPSCALKIHFNTTQKEQFQKQIVDNNTIDFLNKSMLENAEFSVFAKTKEQLIALRIEKKQSD